MWTRTILLLLMLSAEVRGATLDVTSFGALGNCTTIVVNISSGSATVTANSGTPFSASDVGKVVQIFGGDVKATVTGVWGNSPTNFQDRVAIISSFTSSTQVQLDRTLGHTTNGTFMTYGTNNVTAFNNCIGAAGAGDTIHIPSGNYLLMNASALDDGFVQSGEFDIGTPSISLSRGSLTFLGDGTNSTILTANGAWHVKGLQQAFRGTLIKFNSIASNNGTVIFNGIQFNGAASRNHSQLWTGFPAAPTDGSGWDVTHKGIIYASTLTALPLLSITNCLFIHWHGETAEGTDAGTGVVDVGNCGFNDGNATAVNFNGLHSYHDNVCSDYYQFAEDGQFVAGTGTSTIERNTISNIDHSIMIALTGASTNFNGPAYRISRNIFTGTNQYAVTTAGFKNLNISSNQMNGSLIGLGVAGSQGTFWNSNIVVYSNTFVGSPEGIEFSGGGANFVEAVNISNNVALITGNEYFCEAVLGASTRYTNVNLSGNSANKGVANQDTTGQWFLDNLSNAFPQRTISDGVGISNAVSYANGARFEIVPTVSSATFYTVDSPPLRIPDGAVMAITNKGTFSTKVYPSSSLPASFVTLAVNGFITFYWTNSAWQRFATNTAASCSASDIQAAIAASIPGDTVIVPAGTCAPTVAVLLTNQITLQAQGTILQDSIIDTSDSSRSSIINVSVGPVPPVVTRVTGFTFVTGSRATRLFDSGSIHLGGGANLVRIDHNTFNAKLNIPIGGGDVFGVVDHNIMDNVGSFTGGPKITHQTYGGSVNGFGAWALPSWTNSYHEDGSALYFEDNFCTNSSGAPGIGFDGFGGTRHVIRHNILDRYITGDHGTETTAQFAGARLKDVYNNLFVNHGDSEVGHYRSGSGVVTSNTIVNSSGTFTVRNYRMAFGGFYHFANGTNAWDNNDSVIYGSGTATSGGTLTMTDATKTWTTDQWHGFSIRNVNTEQASLVVGNTANTVTYISPTEGANMAFTPGQTYQFRKIITVLDEVGRGQGTLRNLASPAWPNEVVDPVYCWSNTLDGVTFDMNNGGFYSSVVGQEIINGPNPNWVPYTYPHPLVSSPANRSLTIALNGSPIEMSNIRTSSVFSAFIINHGGTTNLSLLCYDRSGNVTDVKLTGTGIMPLTSAKGEITFTTNGNLCFLGMGNGVKTARLWEWSLDNPGGLPNNATLVTTFDLGTTNADQAFMVTMRDGSVVGGTCCHTSGNLVFPIYRFPGGAWQNYGQTDFHTFDLSGLPSTFISACEQPIDHSLFVFQTRDGGAAINVTQLTTTGGLAIKQFGICAVNFLTNSISVDPQNEPYGEICTVMPVSDWNSNRIVIAFNNNNHNATGYIFDQQTQVSVTEVLTNNAPRTSFITNYFYGHNVLWYTTNPTNQIIREFSSVLPTLYPVNGVNGANLITLRWLSYNTNNQNGVGTKWPIVKQSIVNASEQTPVLVDYTGAIFNQNQYFPYNGDMTYQNTNSVWNLVIDPSVAVDATITITQQPRSTNVYSTQTALFTVTATTTGVGPLTYQWRTNGMSAGTNGPALSVGPCPVAWSGMSVVCVISSVVGSITSATATLTVLPDPVITGQPNNATVGVGQVASFSVTATGQSTLQYQWSKNGSSIGGATASNYSTPATVAGDNNSQFSVLVTDNAGSLQSANATLTVTNIPSPPDPVITAQPQSTNIFNNQTASFGITASGATTLHYQWKTNGVNTGTDSSTLALGTCPIAWNGLTVVCVVSDVAGSVTSSIATLTISADPVISTQPQNVTQFAASSASFSVSATGQTALSYQWSRNGSSVAGATQSAYTTPILTMANNGDSYFVDVTDSAGTLRSATATLTVLPQPPTPPTRIAHVAILRVGVTKAGP